MIFSNKKSKNRGYLFGQFISREYIILTLKLCSVLMCNFTITNKTLRFCIFKLLVKYYISILHDVCYENIKLIGVTFFNLKIVDVSTLSRQSILITQKIKSCITLWYVFIVSLKREKKTFETVANSNNIVIPPSNGNFKNSLTT